MGDNPGSWAGPSVATRALGAGERLLAGPAPPDVVGFQKWEAGSKGLSLGPLRAWTLRPMQPRGPRGRPSATFPAAELWRFVPGATAHARSGPARFCARGAPSSDAEPGGRSGFSGPCLSRPPRPVRLT